MIRIKRSLLGVALIILFCTMLGACGQKKPYEMQVEIGGVSVTVACEPEDIERYLLGKYYVYSKQNEEQELMWDFEYRVRSLRFVDLGEETDSVMRDTLSAESRTVGDAIQAECAAGAEVLGISFDEYVRNEYFSIPYCYESLSNDPTNPIYFYMFADEIILLRLGIIYLSEYWGLEADPAEIEVLVVKGTTYEDAEFEVLKKKVMEYSIANSRIVYRHKNVKPYLFKCKLWDRISTHVSMKHEVYVIGEDGCAAVYSGYFTTWGDDLDPFVGELVCGTASCFGLYRLSDSDDWEFLVERMGGGQYMLVQFDRYITDRDSWDYGAFVNIYGTEPKLYGGQ